MTAEDWEQVKRIVGECLERSESERQSYIAQSCEGSASIAAEVENLIASISEAGDFLETSIVEQAQSEDLQAGQQIGSYQVVELIGHGGMGSVYRAARSSDFRKEVAIKVVKRGMDTEFILQRFRQERQILAAFDHPNIARLLDGGATVDGRPYIVMELITGRPITEYATTHHLTIEKRLRLFQTVCSAVQHAHQNLIVHRDLKAGNIIVTPDGIPKLIDFGIAKLLAPDSERTAAVVRLMTPECASPEQARGEPLNTLTDIYSLGVLLYELLTESKPHPFSSADPIEIRRVICEEEPAKPSTIRPLAGELDNIILKAMHKDASHRYVSAVQISEDIDRFLSGQPVIARRDTFRYRASKFIKRHLVASLAAAVVVVSLAAGLGISLWEAHLTRIQRERADRRFSDVRHMANSLLFDIHDALRNLPGATPARKLIVDRALQYLDRLAQEEASDPALEEDLAAAYSKVGEVQGGRNGDNLGDTAGAMASFQKALKIRKAVAAANPGDLPARRRLARAYRHIASQSMALGQIVDASDAAHQALAISQAIHNDPRHSPEDKLSLADDYESIGDLLDADGFTASLDDDRAALESHRKALEISSAKPEDDSSRAQLLRAVEEGKIATDLTRLGEVEEARRLFNKAMLVFESEARSGSSMGRGNLALIEERIGNTYLISGNSAAALDHYQRALKLWRSYAARDPLNARLQLGELEAYGYFGFALTKVGRVSDGIGTLQRCETAVRAALARDKENAEIRAGLALLQIWLADAYRATGQKGNALIRGKQAVDLYRSLFQANSQDAASRINLAGSWNVVANIQLEQGATENAREAFQDALKLAEPAGGPNGPSESAKYVMADAYAGLGNLANRSRSRIEAETWYRKSANMWDKIAHPFPLNPNSFPTLGPTRVRAELARIDAALAH